MNKCVEDPLIPALERALERGRITEEILVQVKSKFGIQGNDQIDQYLAGFNLLTEAVRILREENSKLRSALAGCAEDYQERADCEGHDCGCFDGGSSTTCEACQLAQTSNYLYGIIKEENVR